MSQATRTPASTFIEEAVTEHRTWFIVLGILLMILGVGAIAFPLLTTIAVKVMIGWLFLVGGVVQVIHAFSTQRWSGFLLNLLVAALYLFAGGWLAFFPLTGIVTLTIFLAAIFVLQGILEAGMAFRMRPQTGWVWMLISGVIAIVLGVLIFAGLPGTALWAIGLLVGINLLSSGLAYLFLGLVGGSAA